MQDELTRSLSALHCEVQLPWSELAWTEFAMPDSLMV
jgi:hypothetical protein